MQSDPLPTNTNGYHGNVHIMVTYSRQNENIVEKKKRKLKMMITEKFVSIGQKHTNNNNSNNNNNNNQDLHMFVLPVKV